MDALGAETFELALDIASGQRSKGELAGHAQVSLWRDWPRTSTAGLRELGERPAPDGRPIPVRKAPALDVSFDGVRTESGIATDQLALVMPTSLCSGQVARLIAEDLDTNPPPWSDVSRFVALVPHRGVRVEQRGRALPPDPARPPRAPLGAPRGPARARVRANPQRRGPPLPRRAGLLRRPLRLGQRADGRRDREGAGEGRGAARGDGEGGGACVGGRSRSRSGGCPAGRLRAPSGDGRSGGTSYRPRRERPAAGRDGRGLRPARGRPRRGRGDRGRARQPGPSRERGVPGSRLPGRGRRARRLARLRPAGDQSGFHVMEAPTEEIRSRRSPGSGRPGSRSCSATSDTPRFRPIP